MRTTAAAVAAALVLPACSPSFDTRPSLVTAPVVLAVRAEPPEARASTMVSFSLLVATPSGSDPAVSTRWAFCNQPRPLTENTTIPSSCFGDAVTPVGQPSPTVTALVPARTCALYGPEAPPGEFRPNAADESGGYYQPVRIELPGLRAFGRLRITCALPEAPVDIAIDYRTRYVLNLNPQLGALTASVAGSPVTLDAIPAGAEVVFSQTFPPEAAESYLRFEPFARALEERVERLQISWFATSGAFENDRTEISDNLWRAPAQPGSVHLWTVLRDDRGGIAHQSYQLQIVP